MSKKILLFDIDGTICESGKQINNTMKSILEKIYNKGYTIGLVGGGKIEKILWQIGENHYIEHYFSEYGNVYHKNKSINSYNIEKIYSKKLILHKYYHVIEYLINKSLYFLSMIDYIKLNEFNSNDFVDIRNGLVYISLLDLSSSDKERKLYIEKDKKLSYRKSLIGYLDNELYKTIYYNKIRISQAGQCGISLYPLENDKNQVIEYLGNNYNEIHYFGDNYNIWGNDYKIIKNKMVIGHPIDTISDTQEILNKM